MIIGCHDSCHDGSGCHCQERPPRLRGSPGPELRVSATQGTVRLGLKLSRARSLSSHRLSRHSSSGIGSQLAQWAGGPAAGVTVTQAGSPAGPGLMAGGHSGRSTRSLIYTHRAHVPKFSVSSFASLPGPGSVSRRLVRSRSRGLSSCLATVTHGRGIIIGWRQARRDSERLGIR
jgi:hypothetical protein